MRTKDWIPPPKEFKNTPSTTEILNCTEDKRQTFETILTKMRFIKMTKRQLVKELMYRNHDIFVLSELPKAGMAKLSPIKIELSDYSPEIGRASCRERVCQYV